ncbi:hypothetical protein [Streptomyces agglomeratus]|uniref:hypothetical protein n=1 Tax=Streptomyces agglomeratus TaxID=285458 RepID=UPI00210A4E2B|nr:hypothetical protein [Streptomyces agglomeratus]
MAEPGNTVTWADRMELLRDSAQQRVLNAPMPTAAMEQLLADGTAHALGRFEGSPVHYLDRWWRASEPGWVALDEAASAQLALHAERYRAAIAATSAEGAPGPRLEADTEMPPAQPEAGAA